MRASPPHHRSFYFCSFSLCESTAKIPLGLALRRAGVRFIPGNRYPGMWSASIQCRVGMNAKLVGKTLKKIGEVADAKAFTHKGMAMTS